MSDSDHSRITDEEVRRIARLARLRLDDEEVAQMKQDMDAILGYVEKLSTLDLEEVEPTAHAVDLSLPLCDEAPCEQLPNDAAVRPAPEHRKGAFVVPKVL